MTGPTRVGFRVVGKVQGVGFRAFVARLGREVGVSGGARNAADGTVRVAVEGGDPSRLEAFRRGLERGPVASRVDSVERTEALDEPMDLEF